MVPSSTIRVACPWCGSIGLPPGEVRCAQAVREAEPGLCEFNCPTCGRLIILPATPAGVAAARDVGAAELRGPVPRELLEAHGGPTLSWDDVLDLRLAVSRTCCPQEELVE